MREEPIIIAIDGYSSTGKSSFAKRIARAYGFLYLDSGALYRAVTLFAMENGFISDGVVDVAGLQPFLGDLNIHFEYSKQDGRSLTFIGGRNVEADIRTLQVSGNVSLVASQRCVRNFVDGILREHGRVSNVVMDGRDIGTTVFPDAGVKIFMTADVGIRAARRAAELREKGEECNLAAVLRNLQERDYIDSHRDVSPLVQASDAIVLDNSHMTFDDQMHWIAGILRDKYGLEPLTDEG